MEDDDSYDSVEAAIMSEEDKHPFGDVTYGGSGGMPVSKPHTKTNTSMTHASAKSTQPIPYMHTYKTAGATSDPGGEKPPQETKKQSKGRGGKSCQKGQSCQNDQQAQGQEVDPLLNLPGGQWLPAPIQIYECAKLLSELPEEQWLPARSQIYDRDHKLNEKTTLNSVKPTNNNTNDLLPSETKNFRLLQVIVKYRDAKGTVKTGRVKLDTCSNGCYALPEVSLPRPWRPWEPRAVKGIQGTISPLGNPTYFTFYKQGKAVKVDTNDPLPGVLPDGCVALLGLDAIYNLGIDIAYAVKHHRHMPIRFIPNQEHLLENRRNNAIEQYVKQGYDKQSVVQTCNLSERVIKEYLLTHPNEYESKPIDINSVVLDQTLSKITQQKLRDACGLYDVVFASNTNTLPPPMKGIEPHMFKLKEGPKPVYEPRPSFPPATAQAITQWLHWGLKADLVGKASPTCSYASRLILAVKYKGSTAKSEPPDGIRVAWAGVRVNDTIIKAVPMYPDA